MDKRIKEFIPQIKDYYTITSDGIIYSDNSGKMQLRKKKGSEYQIINLCLENGQKKTYRVHRLVLMAFNPVNNMDLLEVNHIDGNKMNNCIDNLE